MKMLSGCHSSEGWNPVFMVVVLDSSLRWNDTRPYLLSIFIHVSAAKPYDYWLNMAFQNYQVTPSASSTSYSPNISRPVYGLLNSDTGLPVLASLLGTKSQWSCRWIGIKLKQMGKIPREVITDGLKGYPVKVILSW